MHEDQDHAPQDPLAHVNVDRLPVNLRRLCRALGTTLAFELCKLRGGVPLVVPKQVSGDHLLAGIIGVAGMARLVNAMGGEVIDVPKYDKVAIQLRHQQVHGCLKLSMGLTRTALATGYTKRQILNIQHDLAKAEGLAYVQPDLFGDLVEPDQVETDLLTQADAPCMPVDQIDEEHRELALRPGCAHNPFSG